MVYRLPTLGYTYDALEPYIDAKTMELHHSKHHASYVDNLNLLLRDLDRLANKSLEQILADIAMLPEDIRQGVRNNGGGHLCHSLFWHTIGPPRHTEPSPGFLAGIESAFGGFARFKELFEDHAIQRFGSGWAWLCLDSKGHLETLSTPNQDWPIMLGLRPVLGLDLWEHAYYLKYNNRRADYIAAWWNVVDWQSVSSLYAHLAEVAVGIKHK